MQEAFAALEYERAVAYARQALSAGGLTLDEQAAGLWGLGSALVVLDQTLDAEQQMRLLFRLQLDYEPPPTTSPKVMAVFRKVQVEERAVQEALASRERQRLVDSIALGCDLPKAPVGGRPLAVDCVATDPKRAVSALMLEYRRAGEREFSALALARDENGRWRGMLTGDWTESRDGFVLEYSALGLDGDGAELKRSAPTSAPHRLPVARGTVADTRPFYRSPWFWVATGAAVVGAVVGGVVIYHNATRLPDADVGPVRVP